MSEWQPIDALRALLDYTRSTRQGYVMIPLADRIVECGAEYALALVDGPPEYAQAIGDQWAELKAVSLARIEEMNAALPAPPKGDT